MPAALSKITRARALAITKKMLKEELNHTVVDSQAPFPPGVGPEQRADLQDEVNTEYFAPWGCRVSRKALRDSTTCSEMTTGILDAIPEENKA